MAWRKVLKSVREGLEIEDAFARLGILPDEIDPYLDQKPHRRRQILRAEAEFRAKMTEIVSESATVRRDSKSAQWLLKRKVKERNQMTLKFEGPTAATLTLDLPTNGRETDAKSETTAGPTDPIR